MLLIGQGLLGIAWLVGLVIVVKIFQKEGALKGILALICEIYAWIWGWQHVKENNNAGLMWIWTGLYILGIILYGIGMATGGMPTPPTGGEELVPTEESLRFVLRFFA